MRVLCRKVCDISIHALREEGDVIIDSVRKLQDKFLSTPSVRRATIRTARTRKTKAISIHALREEGDVSIQNQDCQKGVFLSTPSVRRATGQISSVKVDRMYFYPRPP